MSDLVRIPRSGRRSAAGYAKLLLRVNRAVAHGMSFEGLLLKPGKFIPRRSLWPGSEYPRTPILLECAGTIDPGDGRPSTRHWPTLYILWRFDTRKEDWIECARTASESWDWAVDLRETAERLLREDNHVPTLVSAERAALKIETLIEAELQHLAPGDRAPAIGMVHETLCRKIAHLAG